MAPNNTDPGGPGPLNFIFANQFKWAPTTTLNVSQFKWAPNNNIDPAGQGPSISFLPINLNGPLQKHLNGPQFKWAPNNNIDIAGPGPLNLIFANQFKRITRVKLWVFILKVTNYMALT